MSKTATRTDAPTGKNESDESPRLTPIEKPSSFKTRMAYALARWQQGTVITPMKVIWARLPEGIRQAYETNKLEDQLTLDSTLHLLVKTLVATINGCAFCQDIAMANTPNEERPADKLSALRDYESDPAFDPAEKAALAFAEESTRDVSVADETFEALRAHFDEREIVELTWLVAVENYYNRMNRALGIGSDGLCEMDHDLPT